MAEKSSTTNATLTEHLAASAPGHPETEGPCKITREKSGATWAAVDGEKLDADPDEYRVECSCGETFNNWGKATRHVDEEH